MRSRLHASWAWRWLIASCAGCVIGGLHAQTVPPIAAEAAPAGATVPRKLRGDETIELERLEVRARPDDPGHDATGMGSYEYQLRDSPFSNDDDDMGVNA